MSTFKVIAKTRDGKLVVAQQIEAVNVSSALDIAELHAKRWNRESNKDWLVNLLSCQGYVRGIL